MLIDVLVVLQLVNDAYLEKTAIFRFAYAKINYVSRS